MPNTKLNLQEPVHDVDCVCTFACWWREMVELELAMEYRRSSAQARTAWDSILSSQIPSPVPALGIELRACVFLWQSLGERERRPCGTFLDALIAVAMEERLDLPRFAVLAVFRLRLRLSESDRIDDAGERA